MSNLDTQLKTFLRVAQLGSFRRSAHIIYPSNPSHPDVQAIALQGLREVAANNLIS